MSSRNYIASKLLSLNRPYNILAIETSCDDTCVSIINSSKKILSEIVHTQHHIHAQFKGIVPSLASHEHIKNISQSIEESLKNSKMTGHDIDVVCATRGPGIASCLKIGYFKGLDFSSKYKKYFLPIHHMVLYFFLLIFRKGIF